jgi:hypothetical protein
MQVALVDLEECTRVQISNTFNKHTTELFTSTIYIQCTQLCPFNYRFKHYRTQQKHRNMFL